MLEILKAILFGVIEGITEWLPISSTGHMILLNEFVTLDISEEFWNLFLIVIQLGAILAVVLLFWNKIWPFGLKKTLPGGTAEDRVPEKKNVAAPLAQTGTSHVDATEELSVTQPNRDILAISKDVFIGKIRIRADAVSIWIKIVIACLPAVIFVLLGLDDKCDELFYNPITVAIALIGFGILFIVVEIRNKTRDFKVNSIAMITWQMALIIGSFQLLAAAFPGTSRSGATIIGALLIGISRKAASEFTFILAIPVMLGASLLEIIDFGLGFSGQEMVILAVGMVTAFGVSIVAIKFLLGYIRKHDFRAFGWYRIALGIIVLLYFYLISKG